MLIILVIIELVLICGMYLTRRIYKNEDTFLFTNESEFIDNLSEQEKGTFIQESRAIALKLFYLLMIVPPFIYFLYICNFNNMSMIIFTLIIIGIISFYILNKMIQLQREYRSKG